MARLVEVLDRYPLRTKKMRDYVIWREAAALWIAYCGNRWTPTEGKPWPRMAEMKLAMEEGRKFRP